MPYRCPEEYHPYPESEKEPTFSLRELEAETERPWTYIARQLVLYRDQLEHPIPELRKLKVPVRLVPALRQRVWTNVPAVDWLTVSATANQIGVDYQWVCRRVLYLSASNDQFENRLVDNGIMDLHLSPIAVRELTEIRNSALQPIDYERQFTINTLSKLLQRHELWVKNRLRAEDTEALGLDQTGKVVTFYGEDVFLRLQGEKEQAVDSGDWLSIPTLCKKVKRERDWVIYRLEEIGIKGEHRRNKDSGRMYIYFPPETAVELKKMAVAVPAAGRRWHTLNHIQGVVGKSLNWINPRLKRIIEGRSDLVQQMTDETGAQRTHYEKEVQERLLEMKKKQTKKNQLEDLDSKERLLRAFHAANKIRKGTRGREISLKVLMTLGITQAEIELWKKYGLISIWREKTKPTVYFTSAAEDLVRRLENDEAILSLVIGLRDWLES